MEMHNVLNGDIFSIICAHIARTGCDAVFHRLNYIVRNRTDQACRSLAPLYAALNRASRPAVFVVKYTTPVRRTLKIPMFGSPHVHVMVDWGDHTTTRFCSSKPIYFAAHTYSSIGMFTVRMYRECHCCALLKCPALSHLGKNVVSALYASLAYVGQDNLKGYQTCIDDYNWPLLHVQSLGNLGIVSLRELCSNFSCNPTFARLDTLAITDMNSMFHYNHAFNQPLQHLDTQNVTDMTELFHGASRFNQPLGEWNVGRVTSMYAMFAHAVSFNQPLASWDVSNVTSTVNMFRNAEAFNQPLAVWNLAKVESYRSMFTGATAWDGESTLEAWAPKLSVYRLKSP